CCSCRFFFQAEDGIRDDLVTGVQTLLFRSHGVPYSIKDLAFTRGVRTMSGSHIFATRVPDVDAPFVRRLAAAGGVMLGKTTSPEFGWKALGDSPLTGITRNPWNTAMTTGGSSSGAAAAAARC